MAAHRGKEEKRIERWEPAVLKPVVASAPRPPQVKQILEAVLESAPRYLPAEAQIAEAVLEVKAIQARLERAADQTEGVLRARAYGLVEALRSAVVAFVGGEQ